MNKQPNKLAIISDDKPTYQALFKQAELPDLVLTESCAKADILLADPPLLAASINTLTQVAWVQSTFAGVDALINPALKQDYQLTNVRGIFGQQMAEYVLGYTIAHFRHFERYRQQQTEQQWLAHSYRSLAGKTLFILGTGSIGNHLAKSAMALGLRVIGVNRTGIPPKDSVFAEIVHIEQLPHRLPQAEILVSTLPDTPQTQKIFNQAFFARCQQTLFFNVGRGSALDTPALLEALEQGWIAHAVLDVFVDEPISQQSPYWQHPNITVTPHIAAYSFPEQVFDIFTQNYLLWLSGGKLKHAIDFDKGY
jgi:phosphoglycerate dehydrogenase-like enzyme